MAQLGYLRAARSEAFFEGTRRPGEHPATERDTAAARGQKKTRIRCPLHRNYVAASRGTRINSKFFTFNGMERNFDERDCVVLRDFFFFFFFKPLNLLILMVIIMMMCD